MSRRKITTKYNAKLNNPKYLTKEYVKKNRPSADIAVELGVSFVTVLNRLKEFGIPVKKRGGVSKDGNLEISALKNSGFTPAEISKKTKTSYTKVYYLTVTKAKRASMAK